MYIMSVIYLINNLPSVLYCVGQEPESFFRLKDSGYRKVIPTGLSSKPKILPVLKKPLSIISIKSFN